MTIGKYIGSVIPLQGETALLRPVGPGWIGVLVQFNNLERLGRVEDGLAFGWHWFPASDWEELDSRDDSPS